MVASRPLPLTLHADAVPERRRLNLRDQHVPVFRPRRFTVNLLRRGENVGHQLVEPCAVANRIQPVGPRDLAAQAGVPLAMWPAGSGGQRDQVGHLLCGGFSVLPPKFSDVRGDVCGLRILPAHSRRIGMAAQSTAGAVREPVSVTTALRSLLVDGLAAGAGRLPRHVLRG